MTKEQEIILAARKYIREAGFYTEKMLGKAGNPDLRLKLAGEKIVHIHFTKHQ